MQRHMFGGELSDAVSNAAPTTIIPSLPNLLSLPSILLSDGGLDSETLDALGDVKELNDALDGAVDMNAAGAPIVSGLTNLVSSPLILAVPIGAGGLLAGAVAFFISSYANGRDD
jgi:hypothetical protein